MSHADTLPLPENREDGLTPDSPDTPEVRGAPAQHQPAFLGLLEELDRNGATVGRMRISHWPVTVGRALSADLVLDDPHVAPEHLRIDRCPSGAMQVQVLETVNGVSLGKTVYPKGAEFAWTGAEPLALGHTGLRLRLPGQSVAPELALTRSGWTLVGMTFALVMSMLALEFAELYLRATDPAKFMQTAYRPALGMLAALCMWAGAWALATKLFTGNPQFWRHVRVAGGYGLVAQLLSHACYLLAFVFSWENLARFEVLVSTVALAAAVGTHLLIALAPRRPRRLIAIVATLTMLGWVTSLSTEWLQNKRLSKQLYMSTLLPPSWRLAPAVPVAQFMDEAGALRQRLDERLKDQDAQDGEPDEDE